MNVLCPVLVAFMGFLSWALYLILVVTKNDAKAGEKDRQRLNWLLDNADISLPVGNTKLRVIMRCDIDRAMQVGRQH